MLDHVMQRMDSIENNILTKEHVENNILTKEHVKKVQDLVNRTCSRMGDVIKMLKEKQPITNERVVESPDHPDKFEEIFSNLSIYFGYNKNT